jgi:hypothetical protein
VNYGESCLASHKISSDAQKAVMEGLQNGINMGNHKISKTETLLYFVFVAASMFSNQEYCTENVQLQTGALTQQTQLYQPKPKLYSACE